MGVPADLLGKQVRCPHCKQVVLAPLTVGPASGPVPAPVQVPVPVAPPPPPPPQPVPVPVVVQPPAPQPVPVPVPVPVAPPPPPVVPMQPVMIVPPPAPVPIPVPVPVPVPAPQPEAPLPVFNIPTRKEGADSILSEPDESDDEVFGSHPGGRVRTLPPLDLSPVAPGSPSVEPPAPLPPTTELPNQHGGLVEVSMPVVYVPEPPKPAAVPLQPAPLPPAPVQLQPVPAPAPVADAGNPFASFESGAANAPAPAPALDERAEDDEDDNGRPRKKKKKRDRDDDRDDEPEEREKPSRNKRAATAPAGKSNILLFVVIGWAVIASGLAVYGLFIKSGDSLPKDHPLSTVPDNFGEFSPAERRKVSQYRFKVDGELPADQRAALGGKIEVGGLEIEPVEVRRRRLELFTDGQTTPTLPGTALVLRMKIKNVSEYSLFPMDPAFTRKANPGKQDHPITRLVLSKDKFFAGGAIEWPNEKIKKRYEKQQLNDYEPLAPGEVREYVVFTDARPDIVRDVQNAKDALQWRVQVRRAPIQFRGKDAPVTAIIGVDFKASDILLQ
jgi:hypothetical protein